MSSAHLLNIHKKKKARAIPRESSQSEDGDVSCRILILGCLEESGYTLLVYSSWLRSSRLSSQQPGGGEV